MLIAGIRRNRFATFIGTDVDLTCVHMTALNCLVRNATSYIIINGNSLTLATHGGYHVRRSPLGGELYRLSQEQTDHLIRLPFSPPDVSTALSSAEPGPTVQEPSKEAQAALEEVAKSFPANKRGQGEFGF